MNTLGIGPGKIVGIIKDSIKDAILEGTIKNNHDEAWELMLKIAAEHGHHPQKIN